MNCYNSYTFSLQDQLSDESESNDEEDRIPLANFVNRPNRTTNYRWRKKYFVPPATDFTGVEDQYVNIDIETPLQYFERFVTADMIDHIVQHTNLYSVQKTGKNIATSRKEIEKVVYVLPYGNRTNEWRCEAVLGKGNKL